jgi:hypothetical protein
LELFRILLQPFWCFFGCFVAWSFKIIIHFHLGVHKTISLFGSLLTVYFTVATGVCYLFHWVSNLCPLNVIMYYAWPWVFWSGRTDFVFIFYTKLCNVRWSIMQTCIACGWLLFAVSCVFLSSH